MNVLQKRILEILISKGSASRSEICAVDKMARTTVYDNLVKLERMGLVKKYSKSSGYRGRPKILWKISGDDNS